MDALVLQTGAAVAHNHIKLLTGWDDETTCNWSLMLAHATLCGNLPLCFQLVAEADAANQQLAQRG